MCFAAYIVICHEKKVQKQKPQFYRASVVLKYHGNSLNFTTPVPGSAMEFSQNIEESWKNHGILTNVTNK